ncbi:MAG: glycosyltransferase family 39 protein [Nibricoccus sp.]
MFNSLLSESPERRPAPLSRAPAADRWSLLILGCVIAVVVVVRLRLGGSPLERDEGEYAYMGQLMLQGIPPYTEAANMKFPGTYVAYALIEAVFGQTARGIRNGLIVVNLATVWLIYRWAILIYGSRVHASIAAIVYASASLSYSFLGQAAHATHFVVLAGCGGSLLLLRAMKVKSAAQFLVAGAVSGLAYLSKQSGFSYVIFGLFVILDENRWRFFQATVVRQWTLFLVGAFAPFAVTVGLLNWAGALDPFVFWTFQYARHYGATWAEAVEMFVTHGSLMLRWGGGWIWCVPVVVVVLMGIPVSGSDKGVNRVRLVFFLLISIVAVSLGLMYRPHYWIQVLPAVALITPLFFSLFSSVTIRLFRCRPSPVLTIVLCLAFWSAIIAFEGKRLFVEKPEKIANDVYFANLVNELVPISKFIQSNSKPSDRVFVFGSEPQVFFYSKRHSATSFIYLYSLFEDQPYALAMQQQVLNDVESKQPEFFVDVSAGKPIADREQRFPMYKWKSEYLLGNYNPVLMIDYRIDNDAVFTGENIRSVKSLYGVYATVWKRK